MTYTYEYNGTTYSSAAKVRAAIWAAEHKAFAAEPDTDKATFWAALGVTYTETEAAEVTYTLAQTKAIYKRRLENSFDERIAGSIITSQGYNMQFDTSDCMKVEGAIRLLEAAVAEDETATGYLTQADDVTVYGVDLSTMQAVLLEMLTAYATCHAQKQTYRAAIAACETVAEVEALSFDWSV